MPVIFQSNVTSEVPPGGTLSTVVNVDIPAGATLQVSVPSAPVAAFTGSPLTGNFPLTVQFTDQSTNSPTSWAWNFGDGNQSTQQNPSHQYSTAGMYSVSLTVSNVGGQSTATKAGYVVVSQPGTIPDVVEWWMLGESSSGSTPVTRSGSLPTTPVINPAQINLDDNGDVPSVVVSGANAAQFSKGKYLANHPSNSVGRLNNRIFMQGCGSWTLFGRIEFSTLPGGTVTLLGRDTNYDWDLYLPAFPKNPTLESLGARNSGWTSIASTVSLQAGQRYSIACGYDATADQIFVVVVDNSGNLTRNSSASGIGRRTPFSSAALKIGNFHTDQNDAAMQNVVYCRSALTNAEIQTLHNGGALLPFSQSLLAPARSSGPAPFSNFQVVQTDFDTTANVGTAGLYWYSPYPLATWNPSLAASLGNFVWFHSTDHIMNGTGTTCGVFMGFSSSPAVRPTSWVNVLPGNGVVSGRTYQSLELPFCAYNPSDPNGRPFYLYAKGVDISGFPSGLGTSQETYLWTSSNLTIWVSEGVAIASNANSGHPIPFDLTGYATIFPPSSLPNQTTWYSYHLGNWENDISLGTPSADGKTFTVTADPEELDENSPFPTGYDEFSWFDNVFSPDGVNVYGVGRCFMPGGRGAAMTQLAFENGAWRLPTGGKIWELFRDTDVSPNLGYSQDVRTLFDPSTKLLHMYRLKGFYPNSGDERIDYMTLQMN